MSAAMRTKPKQAGCSIVALLGEEGLGEESLAGTAYYHLPLPTDVSPPQPLLSEEGNQNHPYRTCQATTAATTATALSTICGMQPEDL
jgi:hypothetical protein